MPRSVVSRSLVPSFSRLDDVDEIDKYWRRLMALWGVRQTHHPGCNPASICRSDLPNLASRRYSAALKSDGVRYALMLTTRIGTPAEPVALMIDRSKAMYEVEAWADDSHFIRGTVLEGELVWRQPHEDRMVFQVFDVVRVTGELVTHEPYESRLRRVTHLVQERDEPDIESALHEKLGVALMHHDPPVDMRAKRFVDVSHATKLWAERRECDHRVDGLILMDIDAPYHNGTTDDGTAYKWKEHVTIDLRLDESGKLHAADGPLPERLHDRKVRVESSRIVESDEKRVMEYHVAITSHEVVLFPVRARPDKTYANGLRVIHATVLNALEHMDVSELVSESL